MKATLAIILLSAAAVILTGCLTAPKDQFAEYLARNNLHIQTFTGSTNSNNLGAEIELVSTLDSNHFYNCYVMMEDLAKRDVQAKNQSDLREAMRNNIHTNECLQLLLLCQRGDRMGWLSSARPLDSTRVRDRFPGCRLLSVNCSDLNPIFTQPMVIGTNCNDGGISQCFILGNAPTVAKFITKYKRAADTIEAARDNIDLLAELQSWEVCHEMPKEMSGQEEAKDPTWVSGWKYQEVPTSMGWQFKVVFQTDSHHGIVRRYQQFQLEVLRDGTMTIREIKDMGGIGGYM